MTIESAATVSTGSWSYIFPNLVLVMAYISIMIERIPKVATALVGSSILIVCHYLTQEEAFACIDFNVINLLVGMMILINILGHTGALNALGILAARLTRGHNLLMLLVFSLLTALLSAIFDNVTTVILIGSITCAICKKLDINPVPFLVSETICSNIGGTATLIGDPPNIMIGSAARLSFNDFLVNLAPVVLIILPVALATLCLIYRKDLLEQNSYHKVKNDLPLNGAITDYPLMIKSIAVLVCVFTGFIFHGFIGLEAGTIAMAGAALLLMFENRRSIWNDVEWTTIFFFIGLFVMVGAVEKSGTVHILAGKFIEMTGHDTTLMTLSLLNVSAFASAIIDNVPYTATMIPMVESIRDQVTGINVEPLWWALALGACLGGNGSLIGATANVIVADMAKASGSRISFLQFTLVGGLIMIQSLAISSIYLWCRYLG
ncbi:MAG: ArsB/NhaD family transporter [Candidatus Melainabacteria bacterium]|nr:ArsB/NhaD family transporter [Candidatus Melainabacteria bacterium]